jgi:hypothetical protein
VLGFDGFDAAACLDDGEVFASAAIAVRQLSLIGTSVRITLPDLSVQIYPFEPPVSLCISPQSFSVPHSAIAECGAVAESNATPSVIKGKYFKETSYGS